jgi:hypothetical protein
MMRVMVDYVSEPVQSLLSVCRRVSVTPDRGSRRVSVTPDRGFWIGSSPFSVCSSRFCADQLGHLSDDQACLCARQASLDSLSVLSFLFVPTSFFFFDFRLCSLLVVALSLDHL